jgi:hypothetical protein
VRTLRHRAIAVGGRTIDRDEERMAHPIDLLASAIGGLPDLTAAALIGIDLVDRELPTEAIRRARRQARDGACRVLRLCQRALEADARNGGYDWDPWVDTAIRDTAILLDRTCQTDPESHDSLHHAAALATAIGKATTALTYDRMAVPETLCTAQTHALILALAAEALSS